MSNLGRVLALAIDSNKGKWLRFKGLGVTVWRAALIALNVAVPMFIVMMWFGVYIKNMPMFVIATFGFWMALILDIPTIKVYFTTTIYKKMIMYQPEKKEISATEMDQFFRDFLYNKVLNFNVKTKENKCEYLTTARKISLYFRIDGPKVVFFGFSDIDGANNGILNEFHTEAVKRFSLSSEIKDW